MTRPVAGISLDLDNEWSYLKTHGDPAWEAMPSYLERVVPRILSFLQERSLQATIFVVGQDADMPQHRDVLALLGSSGLEVGNHSYRHEPWLHLYSEAEVTDEIARAHDSIGAATGRSTRGFRGPGFSLSKATVRVLASRGYEYDASTLPTFIGPLARAYYFRSAQLEASERKARAHLFGSLAEGLRPNRPYRWGVPGGLLEVPVTTMPAFRVPIHVSYLLYLEHFSPRLARTYFKTALRMCRLAGVQPSLLLHPLDFTSGDEVGSLAFFPGMGLPTEVKLRLVSDVLQTLAERYDPVSLGDYVQAVEQDKKVRVVEPSLP